MKLFTAQAPNPLRVNVLVAEKGLEISTEWLDILGGETRTSEHLSRNCFGEAPVLELDDGSYLTESLAICRYLDRLAPNCPLFGTTPVETAKIDMWTLRMDQRVCAPISNFARHTFPLFADVVEQIPAYAQTQLARQNVMWSWLDNELSDGRSYICDNSFSMADIAGMTAIFVCDIAEHPIPSDLHNVKRWESAIRTRKGWEKP